MREIYLSQRFRDGPDRALASVETDNIARLERHDPSILELDRAGAAQNDEYLIDLDIAHRARRHFPDPEREAPELAELRRAGSRTFRDALCLRHISKPKRQPRRCNLGQIVQHHHRSRLSMRPSTRIAVRPPVRWEGRDILAVKQDLPFGRIIKTGDHAEQGRLTASGRA